MSAKTSKKEVKQAAEGGEKKEIPIASLSKDELIGLIDHMNSEIKKKDKYIKGLLTQLTGLRDAAEEIVSEDQPKSRLSNKAIQF